MDHHRLLLLLTLFLSTPTPAHAHYAPSAADEFKRRPIFEMTLDNYNFAISAGQSCTLLFVEEPVHHHHHHTGTNTAASANATAVHTLALNLALLLRDQSQDLLIAHAYSTALLQMDPIRYQEYGNYISSAAATSSPAATHLLLLSNDQQDDGVAPPLRYTPPLHTTQLHTVLHWVLQHCHRTNSDHFASVLKQAQLLDNAIQHQDQTDQTGQTGQTGQTDQTDQNEQYHEIVAAQELKDDQRDLSVIFKTGQTQALLNDHFQANPIVKKWVHKYCSKHVNITKRTARLLRKNRSITRIHINDARLHRIYCEHVFAGEPFVLMGAAETWPAVVEWGTNPLLWSQVLQHKTKLTVDNGLEQSWGSSISVLDFQNYINNRKAVANTTFQRSSTPATTTTTHRALEEDIQTALQRPPWSSVYAYLHQHSTLHDGQYASDVMWDMFDAPSVFKQNNWFQLMGACFKMMTVTFWAAHGARQSNHQDDFGSSKWQVQVYGKKVWIMHPPEQSACLYNGLVDPFRPDYSKYPEYKKAAPLKFELNQGDVLFWSAGWWHATLAIEDSLAIAQNVLNEHNYVEFKRASQLACRPGGSHGIYSPWCACFRRCYSTWDAMYETWVDSIERELERGDSGKHHFNRPNTNTMKPCCDALSNNGIDGVIETFQQDVQTFRQVRGEYEQLVAQIERGQLEEKKRKKRKKRKVRREHNNNNNNKPKKREREEAEL